MNSWKALHAIIENSANDSADNLSGQALYFYLLYQKQGRVSDLALARKLFLRHLDELKQEINQQRLNVVQNNVVALAWMQNQFVHDFLESDYLADLDNYLSIEVNKYICENDGTNTGRVLHIMRYFLERMPHAAADYYLRSIVAAAYGSTRKNLAQAQAGDTIFLGLANGLVGELLLLIDIYHAGIRLDLIIDVVRDGIAALLATKREVDFLAGRYSIFPDFADVTWQDLVFSNHLSWGHGGDLGAALLLYKAQELLQDAELGRIAELVGLNTLLRNDAQTTALTSSQFCQGTAGVAYLYHRLYLLSRHPAYQQGTRFWLAQTEQCLAGELASGFYHAQEPASRCGALGVGIVLLALADEQPLPATHGHVAAVEIV